MRTNNDGKQDVEKWFELYADDIYRFARYSVPKSVDARDVVQEVFLRAYKSWGDFRQDANPRTWLFQIARHHVYDLLRKKRIERRYQEQHPPNLSDVSASLDTLVELEEALAQLSLNKRQVFILRYIQDMSIQETARILGWSQSKVKTTLYRAVRDLQQLLGDVGETEETGVKTKQNEGEMNESQRQHDRTVFPAWKSKT